jgi:hypothetical protein
VSGCAPGQVSLYRNIRPELNIYLIWLGLSGQTKSEGQKLWDGKEKERTKCIFPVKFIIILNFNVFTFTILWYIIRSKLVLYPWCLEIFLEVYFYLIILQLYIYIYIYILRKLVILFLLMFFTKIFFISSVFV